jgi:transposase
VAKAEVVCCARMPGSGRQRMQEVRTVSTMTAALLELGDWLAERGVTWVVTEATSDYWRAPFYQLEDRFETWLVNAHDVKHLPGRPKTDRLDAVWLCKVAERQMLRPSFVPPPQIRQLRDPSRYRVDLLAVRTAEKQRVEKLLEVALIRLSVVVSDLSDEQAQFVDRAADYYAVRNNPERKARHHVRELQALGCSVTLNPAA